MSESLSAWAPWLIPILTAIIGWCLRWWYDDQKIRDFQAIAKTKESDIYHLNEAHTLLLNDKESKIANYQNDLELQERAIQELKIELERAETTNKSLLSTIVEKKEEQSKKTLQPKQELLDIQDTETTEISEEAKSTKSSKKKKGKKKSGRKIKKLQKAFDDLKKENQKLLGQIGKKKKSKPTIKEVPVYITKTIVKKEEIDLKKLRKLLENLPIKKSEEVTSEKKKKGEPSTNEKKGD